MNKKVFTFHGKRYECLTYPGKKEDFTDDIIKIVCGLCCFKPICFTMDFNNNFDKFCPKRLNCAKDNSFYYREYIPLKEMLEEVLQ